MPQAVRADDVKPDRAGSVRKKKSRISLVNAAPLVSGFQFEVFGELLDGVGSGVEGRGLPRAAFADRSPTHEEHVEVLVPLTDHLKEWRS